MHRKATIALPSFAELKLLPGLITVLSRMNIQKPTSIQCQAIPSLLSNHQHHMIAAQTGTGKTLAYVLPLFQQLKIKEIEQKAVLTEKFKPKAVIVVPNKELSRQCECVLSLFKHEVRLKTFSVYSGQKWGVECKALEEGVDILVGTPDRIDKHRKEGTLFFDHLSHLIIDESDTLMDSGYSKHLEIYLQELIKKTKISFVAATFPKNLEGFLARHFSLNSEGDRPFLKQIIEKNTHLNLAHLKHDFIQLQEYDKNPLFSKVIFEVSAGLHGGSCIIFCNSIQSARATEYFVNSLGLKAVSLHGDVPSKERISNIDSFIRQDVKFLVCTDLGSRGLDFPFVNYVVQYDFPKTSSDYLHRAGRAGRAGKAGSVITFYRTNDLPVVKELKNSYDTHRPLNIVSSAFSMKNKEFLIKAKQTPQEKLKNILHKTKK